MRPQPSSSQTLEKAYRLKGPLPLMRRLVVFGSALSLAVYAAWLLSDVLGSNGFTPVELAIVALFTINFTWIALSFSTSIIGLFLRLFNLDPITLRPIRKRPLPERLDSKTVIVVPVYNEDPYAVFARVEAIYLDLKRIGHDNAFDFFILSDTRDPDIWIAEELIWADLRRRLGVRGKIYYRRREDNSEKKSGNLKDFCEKWAAGYEYMVVFDADSTMTARCLVQMAAFLDHNPDTALVQSPPQPVGRNTLFARVLQFISRVHGPTMSMGLSFWQLGDGNYWGHNAIMRTEAFIQHCGLPILSGPPPLGGPILSHDFVEAALLVRAGWKVWFVTDLEGSWEELPTNVIDYAARDRRWCQGNLQHVRVMFGTKFKPISRLHLFMGVMSFCSSPLWFLLLCFSTMAAFEAAQTGQVFFRGGYTLFPSWPIDRAGDMLQLLSVTLGMLIVPKFLSIFMLMARRRTALTYGGRIGLLVSGVFELIFSALLAPVMMWLHTIFVSSTIVGSTVSWGTQNRDETAVPFWTAAKTLKWHTLLGVAWSIAAYYSDPGFFWWMTPVLAGLVFSAALTYYTSREDIGLKARAAHLFEIPEETAPHVVLKTVDEFVQRPRQDEQNGLMRLLEDPMASALHGALVPFSPPNERVRVEVGLIYEKLARLGPESLTRDEKVKILSYPVKPLDQIMAGRRNV